LFPRHQAMVTPLIRHATGGGHQSSATPVRHLVSSEKNDEKSSVGCQGLSWFIIMRPVKNVPCWSILPADQGDSYIFWNVFGSAHVNRYSLCLTIFSAKQQNLLPLDPGNYDQNMHPYLIIYGYEMMAAHLVQNEWLVVGQELDAYPLVNIQQTMENHNFLMGKWTTNSHFQ